MISYDNAFTVEWLCDFHMGWYPFDTQSCTMEFLQQEDSVRPVPQTVLFSGGDLPQHFLRKIAMCSTSVDGKQGVVVEIILGRPIFSSFLTVNSHFFQLHDRSTFWRSSTRYKLLHKYEICLLFTISLTGTITKTSFGILICFARWLYPLQCWSLWVIWWTDLWIGTSTWLFKSTWQPCLFLAHCKFFL